MKSAVKIIAALALVFWSTALVSAQSRECPGVEKTHVDLVRKSADFQPTTRPLREGSARLSFDAFSGKCMEFRAKGLNPNTWYILTLQDPEGNMSFGDASHCLFGAKGTVGVFTFCDILLAVTDRSGRLSRQILGGASDGLNDSDVATPTFNPDAGPAVGDYTGLTVTLREVGCLAAPAPGGNNPGPLNCVRPNLVGRGGVPGLLNPISALNELGPFDMVIDP